MRRRTLIAGAGLVVVVAVVVILIAGGSSSGEVGYRVPSGAMAPTLTVGAHVTADPNAYASSKPRIGDIVVLHPPAGAAGYAPRCGTHVTARQVCALAVSAEDPASLFIKRVVGLPGDTIALRAGHVVRNGRREAEPYIAPCPTAVEVCERPDPVRIPAGHYLVLGDNRPASDDSRFWGAIPKAWIVGRVKA